MLGMKVCLAVALALGAVSAIAADSAISTVQKLYRDFSWETVIVEPSSPGLIDQPRKVLRKYFDEKLTKLILDDRLCAKTTRKICRLDFMPLWDAQDVGATDLAIQPTANSALVEVTFRSPGTSAQKKKLTYQLSLSAEGWRIGDIKGQEWSLVSILERNQ